jgi:hypothetical protein
MGYAGQEAAVGWKYFRGKASNNAEAEAVSDRATSSEKVAVRDLPFGGP